ncbi:phosphotransferase [Amycolatopsis sp. NBC_00345]|uniref:phosphotransferase n=1 Tax=Amycolatopsis sp. NBC_00345 TaxID=2975955 RepID=UPI003FA473CA
MDTRGARPAGTLAQQRFPRFAAATRAGRSRPRSAHLRRRAVVHPDHNETMEPDAALTRVARLIRDFHDAVAGFRPPPDARWQVVIPSDGAEIIAHHDLTPWNLVAGPEWVFIDWDTAAPETRIWDLAYAVPAFAALRPGTPRAEAKRRLRLFADAYGLDWLAVLWRCLVCAPMWRSVRPTHRTPHWVRPTQPTPHWGASRRDQTAAIKPPRGAARSASAAPRSSPRRSPGSWRHGRTGRPGTRS